MAFPTSLDAVSTGDTIAAATINAIEAKIGADSSAVTTSHDYKLSGVTGSDKAVSLTGTETLTNKTLTSPKVGTAVLDTNGNEVIKVTATTSAVNEITITNAAANGVVDIAATGGDTDIDLSLTAKGTGSVISKVNAKCRAYLSSAQDNLVDNTWTKVLLDGETYDPGSNFASNKFVAPVAGYYLVTCQVAYSSVVADKRYHAAIYKDNTIYSNSNLITPTTDTFTVHHADVLYLDVSGYVELYARADAIGGNTVDLITGATNTALTVTLLSS